MKHILFLFSVCAMLAVSCKKTNSLVYGPFEGNWREYDPPSSKPAEIFQFQKGRYVHIGEDHQVVSSGRYSYEKVTENGSHYYKLYLENSSPMYPVELKGNKLEWTPLWPTPLSSKPIVYERY